MSHLIPAIFHIEGHPELFPGVHDPSLRWNGWARPCFSRDVAEHIATWVNADEGDPTAEFYWEGRVLVHVKLAEAREDPNYEPRRYAPDGENRYDVGAKAWTWEDVTAPDGEEPRKWLSALTARTNAHAVAAHAAMRAAYATGYDAKLAYAASTAAGAAALEAHDLAAGNLLCGYCEGRLTASEAIPQLIVHAEDGNRVVAGLGDLVSDLHNRAGVPVQACDVTHRFTF